MLRGIIIDKISNNLYMNTEMILVGIILFSGMTAGAVKIWLNKRKEKENSSVLDESHA
tara:strand:+ start:4710 stop:4883 length:174 start_codon:yes stop_codon:yes gene_type:complete